MSNTLYSTERVNLWNPETDEYEAMKLAQELEYVEKAIEEGHALNLLKQSPGFKIVEEYLKGAIQHLTALLTSETDFRKIRRLQEALKAYNNVLLFIDYKVNEGKALAEQRTPTGANPKE